MVHALFDKVCIATNDFSTTGSLRRLAVHVWLLFGNAHPFKVGPQRSLAANHDLSW